MSFVLVHWLEDNSVGVMPTSAAEKGVELYPGAEGSGRRKCMTQKY